MIVDAFLLQTNFFEGDPNVSRIRDRYYGKATELRPSEQCEQFQ